MLLIAALLALFLAPSPWNVIGLAVGLVLWVGEVFLWHRTVRRKKVKTGAQTLIGRLAQVVTPCKPEGQVRLSGEGEIWGARCAGGAELGDTVRIAGLDGIILIVELASGSGDQAAGAL